MPQITIDVPETLMPLLTRRAKGWRETPEEFIVSYLSVTLEHDDGDPTQDMTQEAQERLEDILEERDKGPFIEIDDPDAFKKRVMAKVKARLERNASHA